MSQGESTTLPRATSSDGVAAAVGLQVARPAPTPFISLRPRRTLKKKRPNGKKGRINMASATTTTTSRGGGFASLAQSSLLRLLNPYASAHLDDASPSSPTTSPAVGNSGGDERGSRWGRRRSGLPSAWGGMAREPSDASTTGTAAASPPSSPLPTRSEQRRLDSASPTKGRKRGNSLASLRGLFKTDSGGSGGSMGSGKRGRSRSIGKQRSGSLEERDEIEEEERRWDEEESERVREEMDGLASKVLFQAGVDSASHPLLVLCPCRMPPPSQLPRPRPFSALSNGSPPSPSRSTSPDPLPTFYARILNLFTTLTASSPFTIVILASPLPRPDASSPPLDTSMPSPAQLLQMYLGLDRKSKKNVERVLVVHPGFWTRLVMRMLLVGEGGVSGKGKRKIRGLRDLSGLANEVPIQQIDIPPQVYEHDLTISNSISLSGASTVPASTYPVLSSPPPDRVFGLPLELLMGYEAEHGLPLLIRDCLSCIRTSGLESEGIFRRPPSSSTLKVLAAAYDRGQTLKLGEYGPDAPFLAASLLRKFVSQLPRGLFGKRCVEATQRCGCELPPAPEDEVCDARKPQENGDAEAGVSNEGCYDPATIQWAREKFIPAFLADLSEPPAAAGFDSANRFASPDLSSSPSRSSPSPSTAGASSAPIVPYHLLLSALLNLLHDITLRYRKNKMDARNLAICIAPVMVRTGDVKLDVAMCRMAVGGTPVMGKGCWTITAVLQLLIEAYYEIFDDGDLLELEAPVPLREDPFTEPSSSQMQPSESSASASQAPSSQRNENSAPHRLRQRQRSCSLSGERERSHPGTPISAGTDSGPASSVSSTASRALTRTTFIPPSKDPAAAATPLVLAMTQAIDGHPSPDSIALDRASRRHSHPAFSSRMHKASNSTIGSTSTSVHRGGAGTTRSRRSHATVGTISSLRSVSAGALTLSRAGGVVDGGEGSKRRSAGVEAMGVSVQGMFSAMEEQKRGQEGPST